MKNIDRILLILSLLFLVAGTLFIEFAVPITVWRYASVQGFNDFKTMFEGALMGLVGIVLLSVWIFHRKK